MTTARPLSRDEIALHEIEWQTRELFNFVAATAIRCGPDRPLCRQMVRTTTRETLRLSAVFDEAEQRVARRMA